MKTTPRLVLCAVAALSAGLAGATDNLGARFGPTQGLINTGARPDTVISAGGTLSYSQADGMWVLDTPVANTLFGPPISANLSHSGLDNRLLVSIHIDNATATTVTSGPNANDLILTGTVGPWSGTLLRGTILKFGYDSDGTQRFNLLFRVEPGGLLSDPAPGGGGYYAGQHIGLIVNLEGSTLPDGADMTADWVATAAPKGNLFPACEGTLGDFVWHDQDGDGVQDPPEPGIDDVDLTLTGIDAYGQQIGIPGCAPPPPAGWNAGISHCFPERMETTAPYQGLHGYYQFGGLCKTPSPLNGNPGYTVAATPPPAPLSTPTLTGVGSTALDSNPNPSVGITLTSSPGGLPPMNPTIDFGFVSNCTGKIGNLVWLDLNGNGIQENVNGVGGEPGLNDVKVELFLFPDLVNPVATQWTLNGYYEFTGLCAGQYAVEVDDAPFVGLYTPTLSDATTDDLDSDPLPFYSVTLPANDSVDLDADFGYVSACALEVGNFAWYDANFNGLQDGGEIGLSNVLITLTYCPNGAPCPGSGNEVVLTQLTNAVGAYKFQGLCAGTYSIKAENPGLQYFPTTSAPHTFPPAVSNTSNDPAPFQFTLGPNSDLNFDYGYMSPCASSLGDYMWYDLLRDGLHDAAQLVEPGINGLIIELHRASDHLLLDTEVTYTNVHTGYYKFSGLGYNPSTGACVTPPTPTFTVRAFTPLTPTLSFQGGDPALDSNGNPTNTISLPNNTHDPKVDIGFLPIDLELMKSVDNSTPVVGTNVMYTLTITNDNAPPGVSTATGVKVKDVLPAGLTFVSANPAAEYDSGSGVWDVGTLAPGASKVLTITATVTMAGVKINYAQVITAGEADVDSTPNNNLGPGPTEDDEAAVPVSPQLPKLTVTKVVVNTGGGTKLVSDFPLFVDGGPVTSGVQNTFSVGGHTVSEIGDANYTAVISGDCAANGSVTLAAGDVKACTITNTFKAPKLTLTKLVVNTGGGTKLVSNFPLFVDGGSVTSGVQNTFSVGSHTVSETGDANYTAAISGDCTANGSVTLLAGDVKACTITNTFQGPVCAPGTAYFNGSDPQSGTKGNIKTYSVNGVNFKVSGWSRRKTSSMTWDTAYVAAYSGGLGVTDSVSDGSGSSNQHTLDNYGAENYLLFEFDRAIVPDQVYLGYVVTDSDATVWFGMAAGGVNPYTTHQTLSNAFLAGLTREENAGGSSTRWANFNAGAVTGNILIVAAKTKSNTTYDTSTDYSNDYFKLEKLTIACPPAPADLSVTKTNGVSSVVAGSATTYTVVVSNAGPSAATAALLKDPAVANLTVTGVACTAASGGAACPAAANVTKTNLQGSGISVNLPVGGSLTFSVTGTVANTCGASSITNTATISSAGTTDPNAADNSRSDVDAITGGPTCVDLRITKTDGVSSIKKGATTTYTIRVTNLSSTSATGAVLKDPIASGLTQLSFACSAASGNRCTAATLPASLSALQAGFALPALSLNQFYEMKLTAKAAGSGYSSVTNTAIVTAPPGLVDSATSNNTASDKDTLY